MRWSLRSTLLAVVLPLTLATLAMSAARVADLVTMREDIAGLRDSAFRSIYSERYTRHLQALLKESFDQLVGLNGGVESVDAARAGMSDTLERMAPFVRARPTDANQVSELTADTLRDWDQTREQIDIHLDRATSLAAAGDFARARRLLADDLEVLLHSRLSSSIDLMLQREQELLEQHQIRVTRATEHGLPPYTGSIDLRERLLPHIYEAILAERLARNAVADSKDFAHHLLDGQPLDRSHGVAASQAMAQIRQLELGMAPSDPSEGKLGAAKLSETYEQIRGVYARAQAQPPAPGSRSALAIVQSLDEIFDRSLLPQIDAIVRTHAQSIDQEMARLDQFAQSIMSLTIGIAVIAVLLGLGSPIIASRLVVRPVLDLVETVTSFRVGETDARPRVRVRNELGILARALHALLDQLQDADKKVRALAFYDSTTGLPNRQFFEERLAGALTTARVQGRSMALISISLDGPKQVNETLGHTAGDDLIRQIAVRLKACVRISDIIARPSPEDDDENETQLSRLESDEFTILLTKIAQSTDAAVAAQRVLLKLADSFLVMGREIRVSTSVGIGIYPQDGGDRETLMRNASAAMNEAVKRGMNDYQFYSDSMNVANSRKLHIQSRLSGAIDRDHLEIHYQPVRHAELGHLTGAEALLRWTDPELGPVGPEEFIPIAENAGLISQIGRWVLSAACEQAREWQEAGYAEIRMSVNVSARQLHDEDLVDCVTEALRQNDLSPGCLELEITETTIIQDDPRTSKSLARLSEMGVGLALDDFGTGYSSLSHLRRLPINRVKIDRSFVSEISEASQGAAVTAAIVALAHSLKLAVVAEGVETTEQANFLRNNGCDELQGYLISRAVPAVEFERYLLRRKQE